ncbi:MAG TPA: zf-HC2 domain-containing protein [Acidimicrobiales bacterium]|nr:zf-HC2 domain-containing protein [Acidimicrobiales bacterium]
MVDRLSHDQVKELLGARVLGVLDDEERRHVDDHVGGCPECLRDLGRLQRAASTLIGAEEPPPPDVWERIKERLREAPPDDG